MPRTHRRNDTSPRHAHFLTFSCYGRYPFLRAERTCHWLRDAIQKARVELEFSLWAYVFTPDHVHLVLWPHASEYDIALIRYVIKRPVAKQAINYMKKHAPEWLSRVTRQRGKKTERSFWQSGGGYDRNLFQQQALIQSIDYIHLNPVRKGLTATAIEWTWSSAGYYQHGEHGPLSIDAIPTDWCD